MEHELAFGRNVELRPKLISKIRVIERDSDSVDEEPEEEDNMWEEHWDEERQCSYWYNPQTNESSDALPVSANAVQLSLVGKPAKVFWPAENTWFPATIARYNNSKKTHKVNYEDGDSEWMRLDQNQERIQVRRTED